MAKYPVLSPVLRGGKLYEIGSSIDLADADIDDALRGSGAIDFNAAIPASAEGVAGKDEPGDDPAATQLAGGAGGEGHTLRGVDVLANAVKATGELGGRRVVTLTSGADRHAAIRAAAAQLGKAKPTVAAIERITGLDTTRAEIEAALAGG